VLGRYGRSRCCLAPGRRDRLDGPCPIHGIVIVETLGLYPIMLLNVQAALPTSIRDAAAAANLGAGRWTVFRAVTLPLMRRAFRGCTLV